MILIYNDERRIKQILTNLLTNSVKYTFIVGIKIIAIQGQKDNTIEISVKDTGLGFDVDLNY